MKANLLNYHNSPLLVPLIHLAPCTGLHLSVDNKGFSCSVRQSTRVKQANNVNKGEASNFQSVELGLIADHLHMQASININREAVLPIDIAIHIKREKLQLECCNKMPWLSPMTKGIINVKRLELLLNDKQKLSINSYPNEKKKRRNTPQYFSFPCQ